MASSSFTIPKKRIPLAEEARKEIQKMIDETVQATKLGELEPTRIFISFPERKDNIYLVEDLLDPFLSDLSFDVHYWIKDRRFGNTDELIYTIMDSCDAIIGLYTNESKREDGKFNPAGNVIHEMAREKPTKKVILCEEGTIIETMSYPKIPDIPFNRKDYGELLVDLLHFLKNSGMITVKTSKTL